jgi:hypothetical protein
MIDNSNVIIQEANQGSKDLKDSGTRHTYSTGAMKEELDVNKGRYDLIPPEALHRLAVHYAKGAKKYTTPDRDGSRNWEAGLPLSREFDSLLRHTFQAMAGMTDEDHLAAIEWHSFAIATIIERVRRGELPIELIDIPAILKTFRCLPEQ